MVKKSSNKFNNVALCTTSGKSKVISIAKQCKEVLLSQNVNVLIDKNLFKLETKGFKVSKENEIKKKSDLLIAIGGDGTMLNCSRIYGSKGIPILGINLGNLGFLTDINPNDLTANLIKVINGEFKKDSRAFLSASVKGKRQSYLALNEVVIHSGSIAQLIEFDLYVNRSFVYRQKADGLIISSSTGSTAYSLSGGGPIVHPEAGVFVLLPMLAQSLNTSPLLIKDDSVVKIILERQKAIVSFDSHDNVKLSGNNEIVIVKAKSNLDLIHPLDHDFFAACRNKLGWSSTITEPYK